MAGNPNNIHIPIESSLKTGVPGAHEASTRLYQDTGVVKSSIPNTPTVGAKSGLGGNSTELNKSAAGLPKVDLVGHSEGVGKSPTILTPVEQRNDLAEPARTNLTASEKPAMKEEQTGLNTKPAETSENKAERKEVKAEARKEKQAAKEESKEDREEQQAAQKGEHHHGGGKGKKASEKEDRNKKDSDKEKHNDKLEHSKEERKDKLDSNDKGSKEKDEELHSHNDDNGMPSDKTKRETVDISDAIQSSIRTQNNFKVIKATQGMSDDQIRAEFQKIKDSRNERFGGTFTGIGVDDQNIHLYANGNDIAIPYNSGSDTAKDFNDPNVRTDVLKELSGSPYWYGFRAGLEKLSTSELVLLDAMKRNDGTEFRSAVKGINNAEELSKQLDAISDFWLANGHKDLFTAKWSQDLSRVAIHHNGYTIFVGDAAKSESDQ